MGYTIRAAIREFTEQVAALMQAKGVTKKELATRLNTTPSYITRIMRGDTNFTVDTMVRLVYALGGEINLRVHPKVTTEDIMKLGNLVQVDFKHSQQRFAAETAEAAERVYSECFAHDYSTTKTYATSAT